VVFLVIILVVTLIQAPAIIATTNDDAFEAVFQSFSLVWSQPWRLILYEVVSAVMAVIGMLVLAFLSKKAFIVMDRVFSLVMGADFINITSHGMYILNIWLFHSIAWVNSILGDMSAMVYFSREFIPLQLPHGYQFVTSYIFAIWMLIIGGLIFSYGLASFNVGNTLSYLILRKKKDDENLIERKDPEEEDYEEEEEETIEELKSEQATEEIDEQVKKESKKKSKES